MTNTSARLSGPCRLPVPSVVVSLPAPCRRPRPPSPLRAHRHRPRLPRRLPGRGRRRQRRRQARRGRPRRRHRRLVREPDVEEADHHRPSYHPRRHQQRHGRSRRRRQGRGRDRLRVRDEPPTRASSGWPSRARRSTTPGRSGRSPTCRASTGSAGVETPITTQTRNHGPWSWSSPRSSGPVPSTDFNQDQARLVAFRHRVGTEDREHGSPYLLDRAPRNPCDRGLATSTTGMSADRDGRQPWRGPVHRPRPRRASSPRDGSLPGRDRARPRSEDRARSTSDSSRTGDVRPLIASIDRCHRHRSNRWHGARSRSIYRESPPPSPAPAPSSTTPSTPATPSGRPTWTATATTRSSPATAARTTASPPTTSTARAWDRTVLDPDIAAQDLRGGDLDGDGTPDVVAVGGSTHNVVWYRPIREGVKKP